MSGLERVVALGFVGNGWAGRRVKNSILTLGLGMMVFGCATGKMEHADGSDHSMDSIEVKQALDCPGGGQKYYEDADGDGYGTNAGWWVCEALPGYVTTNSDCDDGTKESYPGAVEVCDGLDNNCDGAIDEKVTQSCSTKCENGVQICTNGTWEKCSAGTYCPKGTDSCAKVVACELNCTDYNCVENCANKGTMDTGKYGTDFVECMTKNKCNEIYTSCVKDHCLDKYTNCYQGIMTCQEVMACGGSYYQDLLQKKVITDTLFERCLMKANKQAIATLFEGFICLEQHSEYLSDQKKFLSVVFDCNLYPGPCK